MVVLGQRIPNTIQKTCKIQSPRTVHPLAGPDSRVTKVGQYIKYGLHKDPSQSDLIDNFNNNYLDNIFSVYYSDFYKYTTEIDNIIDYVTSDTIMLKQSCQQNKK